MFVRRNEVIRVSSGEDTINEGWLCAKGRFGYEFIKSPDRLKKPLLRIEPRAGSKSVIHDSKAEAPHSGSESSLTPHPASLFKEVEWDEALDFIAQRLKEVKDKYGPDSIAGLSSARCTTEENYIFQKFIRAAIGTNNVDHCARY